MTWNICTKSDLAKATRTLVANPAWKYRTEPGEHGTMIIIVSVP